MVFWEFGHYHRTDFTAGVDYSRRTFQPNFFRIFEIKKILIVIDICIEKILSELMLVSLQPSYSSRPGVIRAKNIRRRTTLISRYERKIYVSSDSPVRNRWHYDERFP